VQAEAAIVMLLVQPADDAAVAHIVFTKRTTSVKTHKGQIGFPGGHRDPEDKDLRATALRETEEEIGIAADRVTLHGCLPLVLTPDAKRVLPFVATTDARPDSFLPSADEVSEIITLPWPVCSREARESRQFVMFGKVRQTAIYDATRAKIWGLTAKVIEAADMPGPAPD
jgi:8-oxo-dGTP pyrophosphatase MutT (NUDIX family)